MSFCVRWSVTVAGREKRLRGQWNNRYNRRTGITLCMQKSNSYGNSEILEFAWESVCHAKTNGIRLGNSLWHLERED